jgi:hypothetical protein
VFCPIGIPISTSWNTHCLPHEMSHDINNGFAMRSLGQIDDAIRQKVGQILWTWKLCGQCTAKPSCSSNNCPWSKADDCDAFWRLHKKMTQAYSPDFVGRIPAINNHQELLEIAQSVKDRRAIPRDTVRREIFEDHLAPDQKPPTEQDQNRALSLAAGLILLMDFGVLRDAANLVSEVPHILWRDGVSMDTFVEEAFPRTPESPAIKGIVPELRANKLTKYAKLRMKATNDIRRHLVLDKKERMVWVFHQGTALRHLLSGSEIDAKSCVLPREVMLEVLDTIHVVLFPPDLGSHKLLEHLVSKSSWDKGLLSNMSTPYRKDSDPEISYSYFGDRLEELHQELQAPTAHGWLQRRLQRRSETYMLMATMYGVIIAVTLGFFSLVVAIFQAWVAWQQLKQSSN